MISFLKKLIPLLIIFVFIIIMTVSCSTTKSLVVESLSNTDLPQEISTEEQVPTSSSENIPNNIPNNQNLNIIPVELTETLESKWTPFPLFPLGSDDTLKYEKAETGWKYVNIRLVFENFSVNFVDVDPQYDSLGMQIKTEQGWQYDQGDYFIPFSGFHDTDLFKIPGGFRIAGDRLRTGGPGDPDSILFCKL